MTNEQQALADMPIWLVILLAVVGGVSGEMWRADKEGARGWSLLRRLALRSGACMICGVSAIMLLYAAGLVDLGRRRIRLPDSDGRRRRRHRVVRTLGRQAHRRLRSSASRPTLTLVLLRAAILAAGLRVDD